MDQRQLNVVFCLGNLVGSAPWPNAVVLRHLPKYMAEDSGAPIPQAG